MTAPLLKAVARFAIAGILICTFAGPRVAAAQVKASDLKQQIVGGWTLVNVVLEQGGSKTEPFGPNPNGFSSYDSAGNFANVLFRADLPKLASNNRLAPSAEESKALASGILVTYGKYSVNDDGTVTLKIDASSFANWNGAEQKRLVTVTGDEMRVTNPTPPSGGGTAYVVWKRAK
jgi:hypothetical protein